MNMNSVLDWTKAPIEFEMWSTTDGHIFYYRDANEKLKEVTAEERKQLAAKSCMKSDQFTSSGSTYSPRREKALKIYLDHSPKKLSD